MEKYKGGFQSITFPFNFDQTWRVCNSWVQNIVNNFLYGEVIFGDKILTLIPFCASLEFTCQGSVDELNTIVDVAFIIHWAILCPTEFVRGINLNSTLSKFHRRVLYLSKYTIFDFEDLPISILMIPTIFLSFRSIMLRGSNSILYCLGTLHQNVHYCTFDYIVAPRLDYYIFP